MFLLKHIIPIVTCTFLLSCENQNLRQASNIPMEVIPRSEGPHAILFENFVNERPFVLSQHINEMNQKKAKFYKNGRQINFAIVEDALFQKSISHVKTSTSLSSKPRVEFTMGENKRSGITTIQGAKTDPADVLKPYLNQDAYFYVSDKRTSQEEAIKLCRTSEYPMRIVTVQIDNEPIRVVMDPSGC